MATIPDLSLSSYLPLEGAALVYVGWLGNDSEFMRGSVPLEFYNRLKDLCIDPWQPFAAAGIHFCELCQFDPPGFSDNLFVPYQGQIFVAPVAIVHYIAVHHYRPPQVFIEAVMVCPPTRSMEYKKALLQNGGRSMVSS